MIKYDGSSASEQEIKNAEEEGELYEVIVKDNVGSIGDYAFQDCSNLTSITISDSVTSIGSEAFDNCSNLTNIVWKGNSYTSVYEFLSAFRNDNDNE